MKQNIMNKYAFTLLLLTALTPLSGAAEEAMAGQRFDCLIEPLKVINVGSPVQGVVQSLAVDRSELIAEGEVLAQIESGVEQASLAQAEVRAQMDGEIKSREADLGLHFSQSVHQHEAIDEPVKLRPAVRLAIAFRWGQRSRRGF